MSAPGFSDHFSGHAALYARVRPRYPASLFTWLAGKAPHRALAWDAGTGNGQAAVALATHFDRVVATDASERQIAEAEAHALVEYRVAPAERSPVEPGSAALVTVAQAAHWFDLPAFFGAVREALGPGGVVALWGYDLMSVRPEVDAVVARLYHDIVGPYWPAERVLVEDGYRTLEFPFEELRPPTLQMEQAWDLAALYGYLRSWSATQRYALARNADPVLIVAEELAAAWGDPATVRPVRFPLFLRIGRVPR
jgi:SAM-dependent methyltransferase